MQTKPTIMLVGLGQKRPTLTLTLSLAGRGDLLPLHFGERAGVRGGFQVVDRKT